MTKSNITQYDNTAANNTDVEDVPLGENLMYPADVNNAFREIMADLADMNDGTVSLTSPSFAAASLTGNLSFGDNNKAIFGAGSDLQIYHDGSNSYIFENGTGSLTLQTNGSKIGLAKASPFEWMVEANVDGAVNLYYDNSQKLATTSTGIDVTGTVTADGLTVDGNVEISSSNALLYFMESDTTDKNSLLQSNAGLFRIQTVNDAKNTFTQRFKIDHATGDISFFEDTGTTAKLFWDASAESLGLGTSSPSNPLTINSADENHILLENGSEAANIQLRDSGNMEIIYKGSGNKLKFMHDSTERMRIDDSGNVLIGTDSGDGFNSDAALRLQKASGNNYVQIKTASSSQGGILIGDTDDDFVGGMIYNNSSNYLRFDSNNAEKMRLEGDGDLHVDGNVVAYSTTISDIRLKKDVAPIEDAVTKVQQLNGCTFTYLKDDRKSAGLIAQDVEKVLPSAVIEDEAVFHGEEGETYKTVQYDQVIGLLVEAVKELKAEIEELKNGTAK